jgi:hypothetical protein
MPSNAGSLRHRAPGPAGCIQSDCPYAKNPFCVEAVTVGLKKEVLSGDGTEQKVLGKRGPVIRTVMLIADDDQPSGETLSAGGPGCRETGQRGPHDNKNLHSLPFFKMPCAQH